MKASRSIKKFLLLTSLLNALFVNTGYNDLLAVIHNEGFVILLSVAILCLMEVLSITAVFTATNKVYAHIQLLFAFAAFGLAVLAMERHVSPAVVFILNAFGICLGIGQISRIILLRR